MGGMETIIESNMRFGRWKTVDTFIKNRQRYWNCVCDCGTAKAVAQRSLESGKSKSCGCLARERGVLAPQTRFGRLVVLESFIQDGKRYWNCVCDCGGQRTVLQASLKGGGVKSCGCTRKERATAMCKARALPNGDAARNEVIYKYKLRARKESIDWELTTEQCEALFKGNCAYCGAEPTKVRKLNYSSSYVYNGIDRIDNAEGYTEKNSVSCCTRCNYMKSDMTVKEFYCHIENIWRKRHGDR